jgi:excisionase family DNA binding protein
VESAEKTSEDPEFDDMGWMSTQSAAKYLGITTRTLYRFIDEDQMPAYKFGRVIRLKRADLDTFIQGSRVEPGSLSNLYPPRKS